MVCPQSVVYHVGGGTLSQQNSKKPYLNFRNGLGLLMKNLPIQMVWYKIPLRIFLDQIAAFKFLAGGKKDDFKAIGKAHRNFLWHINMWRKKRYHHQRSMGLFCK